MKSRGFTLLESVIVLALTGLFLLIGFRISSQSSTQIKEEQFIQNLTGKIDEKVIEGKNNHETVRLFFGEKRVKMVTGKKVEILEYPASLYQHRYISTERKKSIFLHPELLVQLRFRLFRKKDIMYIN